MRRLGVVSIVVVGLLALSQTLSLALSMVVMFAASLEGASVRKVVLGVGLGGAAFVLCLAFGVGLIVWRQKLATRWFGDDDVDIGVDAHMLLRVGLVLFGASLAMDSVQWLLFSAPGLALNAGQDSGGPGGLLGVWQSGVGTLVTQVVRFGIAGALVWWSDPLASILLRPSGARRHNDESTREACPSCGAAYDPSDYREDADARCTSCHAPLPVGVQQAFRADSRTLH